PFGPIGGKAVPVSPITGVPLGPIAGVADPGTPGASVGVPLGPITVGEPFVVTRNPSAPTGACAAIASARSVDDGARDSVPLGFRERFGWTPPPWPNEPG